MGNHEYCTDCGLSSFHRGEPCPAWALEKQNARNKEIERHNKEADYKVESLLVKLKRMGINPKLDSYGNITISKWSL